MAKDWVFDKAYARGFTEARQATLRDVLPTLRQQADLGTALDAGCGVGYFSGFLRDLGFRVLAFDGRQENVQEARRRYPDIEFHTANIEDPNVQGLGCFDLVVCFGLLYHLENPFRAIRNLFGLARKVVLIESFSVPSPLPVVQLWDEGAVEDEALNRVAFYPSEACLVKMLYRAGFKFVYRFNPLPVHQDFTETPWRKRRRTMLAGSKTPLGSASLVPMREPMNGSDPWLTTLTKLREHALRLVRFAGKASSGSTS
jgi:SAM-dependent methyltransferase